MNLFREERHSLTAESKGISKANKLEFSAFAVESPKVIIERKGNRTPSAISAKKFFGTRKTTSKSPTTYKFKLTEDDRKPSLSSTKRNISSELLEGIDQEVKIRPFLKSFRSGRLKMMNSCNRGLRPHFWKATIFDSTVPDAIKITSKTPVSRNPKT